jgi:predicted kinase
MATFHLVTGSTGAGKTTYARALADEIGAVRFSIDEWMTTLFWKDSPQPIQYEWTIERVNRCETQIIAVASELARRGVSAVLDLGFTRADHRGKFYEAAAQAGAAAQLHLVDVDAEERWRRVGRRNTEKGETYSLQVTREMFDFMESIWEPPTTEEMRARAGVRA